MSVPTDFYHSDTLLSQDERALRERVSAWAQERVAPRAADFWERGEFQHDRTGEVAALGIVGATIGAYGCPTLSAAAYCLATREGPGRPSVRHVFFESIPLAWGRSLHTAPKNRRNTGFRAWPNAKSSAQLR